MESGRIWLHHLTEMAKEFAASINGQTLITSINGLCDKLTASKYEIWQNVEYHVGWLV